MSETAALTTVALSKGRAVGTVGVPLPHVEIRIEAPDHDGLGELLVRGENVMRGYHRNSQATAEAFQDGWLRTGDLGCIDQLGFLHITGRKKDVIVLSSGKNIYPEEIEKFYQSNSAYIKEICVVGVPDAASGETGEKLHAVVVPDFDYLKSVEVVKRLRHDPLAYGNALRAFASLQTRVEPGASQGSAAAHYDAQDQAVRGAARSPGKSVETGAGGGRYPARDGGGRETLRAHPRRQGRARDQPSMNLELDLGFTSLERVELLSAIQETFGIQVPDEDASKIHTVADLAGLVERLQLCGEAGREDVRMADEVLRHRPALELLYFLAARVLALACRVLLRFRVEGVENLPAPPYLMCPNHTSYLDGFLMACAVPYRVSRSAFLLGERRLLPGAR